MQNTPLGSRCSLACMICIERCSRCTCLENHFLATDAGSFQVNEGSHLLGPSMLSDEAVAGLKDDHDTREEWLNLELTRKILTAAAAAERRSSVTCRMFSSAPLKRKTTPWWRGVDWLAREWRTSSMTAQLTASSLAPEAKKSKLNGRPLFPNRGCIWSQIWLLVPTVHTVISERCSVHLRAIWEWRGHPACRLD